MKIGIYDPYLDTMSGGERYMLSLAKCLKEDKHEVAIFWNPNKKEEIFHEAERKFHMNLQGIEIAENIFSPQISFFQRFSASRAYDKIIVLSDGSIPLLACATILHFQSPIEWVASPGILERIKLKRLQQVICNSFFTKQYIDRKFHLVSKVLYPPIDLPNRGAVPKENLILNLGRMGIMASGSSYKKQEVLLDAFKQLHKQGHKDWQMVFIINVKETEREVANAFIASTEGLPVQVEVNQDMDKVKAYYAKAKIYWHAAGFGEDLTTHPDRAEHFGLATVEAMHYGAVPIVINAGGQPEIVTEGENGFLWDTVAELLKKTQKIMENEALCFQISMSAQKKAQDFTLATFCRTLTKLLS